MRLRLKLSIAACKIKLRRGSEGERRMENALSSDLDEEAKAVFYNNRAYVLWREKKDLPNALKDVENALSTRPGVPDFWHTKGLILEALKKTNLALNCYRRVLQLSLIHI